MINKLRVVHYVNQFFAGVGGEEAAYHPLKVREGAVGPGILLQRLAGGSVAVVATVICGDAQFLEAEEESTRRVISELEGLHPDMFVAGPAFASGEVWARLPQAVCGRIGAPEHTRVSAVHPENPAVGLQDGHSHVYVAPTGETAASMGDAMDKITTPDGQTPYTWGSRAISQGRWLHAPGNPQERGPGPGGSGQSHRNAAEEDPGRTHSIGDLSDEL